MNEVRCGLGPDHVISDSLMGRSYAEDREDNILPSTITPMIAWFALDRCPIWPISREGYAEVGRETREVRCVPTS